ncbi:MAG: DNA (cytosine-5-)-methyltransferase [Thermoprotei archaeon]|nr:MAG: DNA (cytosine-5-)-methyltransferase [Thermoprotei archaeon]RLE81249.1 MAG: DNA (cytosine-5-)-methyltransferase [Thermoprotei archaeon]RLF02744.1 MAG: DNA (cytosine-5-)-methyltransferase [Thermoprotei archaeon]
MYRVVDLFCGGGGFARGFQMEGFKIVLGVDNYPPAVKTFQENFREAIVFDRDIQEVHSLELLEALREPPDVIIGGPPCESFTRTNPLRKPNPLDRLYVDPLGRLVLHFIRIVGDLKPEVFVMENVPGILEGDLKICLQKEFARVGYRQIYFNILRAEDYGTPSRRVRVFISNTRIKPPKAGKRITVIEAIGDLPEPNGIYDIPNHEYVPISKRRLRKIRKLKWGQALVYYEGAQRKVYRNFIRLHPFKLAPTVMGSSRFIHPFKDRLLTVREQARLMAFPDDHIFYGSKDAQFNQVGEAVPVALARAIARTVKNFLEGEES